MSRATFLFVFGALDFFLLGVSWCSGGISTALQAAANLRLSVVSPTFFCTGETWTTINVLLSPPDSEPDRIIII